MLHSFVKSMIEFRREAEIHNVAVRQLSDLWYVLISAAVIGCLRKAVEVLLKQTITDRIVAQGLSDYEFRIQKSLKQAKDIIYYGIISVNIILPILKLDCGGLCVVEQTSDPKHFRGFRNLRSCFPEMASHQSRLRNQSLSDYPVRASSPK
jgi:hypothetical protein